MNNTNFEQPSRNVLNKLSFFQSTLGKKRIAHTSTLLQPTSTKVCASTKPVPTKSRPVMPLELGSKIPWVLRKRYLNSIIDELLKFCTEDEAYERVCVYSPFQSGQSLNSFLSLLFGVRLP